MSKRILEDSDDSAARPSKRLKEKARLRLAGSEHTEQGGVSAVHASKSFGQLDSASTESPNTSRHTQSSNKPRLNAYASQLDRYRCYDEGLVPTRGSESEKRCSRASEFSKQIRSTIASNERLGTFGPESTAKPDEFVKNDPQSPRMPSRSSNSRNEQCIYSGFNMSRRLIAPELLGSELHDKTLLSISDLLAQVKAPNYELPDADEDIVVFGIVAQKSEPRPVRPGPGDHSQKIPTDTKRIGNNPKFMALKLVDLKWELDLLLFDSGFDSYWKLSVGHVIAILNPIVMKPRTHMLDTGRFSLKVTSSEDTIIEIGTATNLGFCKSIKKDGTKCSQWINTNKTEYCDYHVNMQVERSKTSRMEVNTMSSFGLFDKTKPKKPAFSRAGPGVLSASNKQYFQDVSNTASARSVSAARRAQYYDREAHEVAYCIAQRGNVDNSLIKAPHENTYNGNIRTQKRLATSQSERTLMKKLKNPKPALRCKQISMPDRERTKVDDTASAARSATELELIGNTRTEVNLGPVQTGRSHRHDPLDEAVGWRNAFKRNFEHTATPTVKDKQTWRGKVIPAHHPVASRAESKGNVHGNPMAASTNADADENDDLEIVV